MLHEGILARMGRLLAAIASQTIDNAESSNKVALVKQAIREIDAGADEARYALGKSRAEEFRLKRRREELDAETAGLTAPAAAAGTRRSRRTRRPAAVNDEADEAEAEDPQQVATSLLERALRLGQEKDDADWLHNSAVKAQMKRMDPSFSEKSLGFRSFSDFLRSRSDVVQLDESSTTRMVRLKTAAT